jgi:methionyl-tRNA formyltransferase
MAASILFLGTDGVFSRTILQALLGAGCDVVRVWLAGSRVSSAVAKAPGPARLPPIPVDNLNTIGEIARVGGIPLQRIASARELCSRQGLCTDPVDIILAACFPFRLPKVLLAFPTYGCFNLHPSRLPAYRGPLPLFWQLRAGLPKGGITLHAMAEELDAGDIVAQESLPFPAGITAAVANQQLAEIGGRLAVRAFAALESGPLRRQPQEAQYASYFSWPKESDFRLCTHWSAERAFRFIRGTADWGQPYPLMCGDRSFSIVGAAGFSQDGMLDSAWEWRDAELWVRFTPGILRAIAARVQ